MIFQSIVIPVSYHNKFPKFVYNVIDLQYLRSNYKNCLEFPFNIVKYDNKWIFQCEMIQINMM